MNESGGYIKLYRKLLDDALWKRGTPEQKVILITLLAMANHAENEWIWQGQKYHVQPGQFITSLEGIRQACGQGISIKNIRTALEHFEKFGFLANESTKSGRLITIEKWAFYQTCEAEPAMTPANRRQSTGKEVATNKNDKNDKKQKGLEFFSRFWSAYPKKDGKQEALKAFEKLNPSPELLDQILKALEGQKVDREQKRARGEFVPSWKNAQGWLSGQRWTDEAVDDQQDEGFTGHFI